MPKAECGVRNAEHEVDIILAPRSEFRAWKFRVSPRPRYDTRAMSEPNRQLGLVSNCWQTQLARGESLDALIAEAARRGYRAVELRQGCLGTYESGNQRLPHAVELGELTQRFPQLRLTIAIDLPFLDGRDYSDDPLFAAGRQAAQALGSNSSPHLRLVDLTTTTIEQTPESVNEVGSTLATLARKMSEVDGVLSFENARQPWASFWTVFQSARRQLGADGSRLKLCYDPVNLLLSGEAIDPVAIAASISPDEISMVHFKQRCNGRIAPAVCDGDIDWRAQLAALRKTGYCGPHLFEVASHKNLWEYLAGSHNYLRRRGLELVSASSTEFD